MTTTTTAPGVVSAFDLCGPLPIGTTVVQASAGTGKTFAIVGLAVRYVAETGIDIAQLLLVTFSRAATRELRERTRARFVTVSDALTDPAVARRADDTLIRHLAHVDDDEVFRRRMRLLAALSDFDAGAIATTHSFCQRMLEELGVAGEREPGSRLVDNVDDIALTTADDLYLSRYARTDPPFSVREAHTVAVAAVRDRQAWLAPDTDDAAGERAAFATAVRSEVERRKRLVGIRDFDDLLILLRAALADPVHGRVSCQRIADRYRVALVDEFQDTDPLQWDILRRAFHGSTTLVLVGDPKQSIYAFRGAEVLSYLEAIEHATVQQELTTNWRSDAGLLVAVDHLLGGAALGHDQITVRPIAATRPWSRLWGRADLVTPLRLRCLPRTGAGPLNKSGYPTVGRMRARVADDLAADIVELLESGTRIADDGSPKSAVAEAESVEVIDQESPSGRPVGPGDIAVLVRTRSQIDVVRAALDRIGVASVLAGGTSVFATDSATDWLWVLRALEQPHRGDRVRLAACTPLFGYTAADIDEGGAELVGRVSTQLREAARLFVQVGFAAVFEKLAVAARLAPRLLAAENGERQLTDLRHIAQLLDRTALTEGFGPTALTRWLADRVRDPASGAVADRSRRLDRDTAAVHVATVHASKGLEFPIVYLPFAWDSAKNPKAATLLYHEDGDRVLDIGGQDAPGYGERKKRAEHEEAGEELRLCYVALTRAECQVVAWWAPAFTTATSPLHRLVFGRGAGESTVPERATVPADSTVLERITAWAAEADDAIAVTAVTGNADAPKRQARSEGCTADLSAAPFDRALDHQWRRTSYSALTAGAHAVVPDTEPEDAPGAADEPDIPTSSSDETPSDAATLSGPPSLMNDLPYGADFGTLVHGVLERVDTDVDDLAAQVHTRCAEAADEIMADMDPAILTTALLAVLRTPLGFGSLAEIGNRDRLCELEFEIPLAGGDDPAHTSATLGDLTNLLHTHLPPGMVFHDYADRLAALDDTALRGYLTGSIDAVLRVRDDRFVVVDYKTNRLGTGDLTVAHYTRDRMAAEMAHSHYPLQALIYAVALHRYLRWRLPDYQPSRHLGGVRYLFVRGMIGPETPTGAGVFDWDPPVELIIELSELLAGGRSR